MSDTAYYPPPSFAFSVIVASGASAPAAGSIDAAFQEVSGIESHMEIEEVKEGGLNSHAHPLPGVTKHGNLVLKRGYVTQASTLWNWVAQTVGSTLGSRIQPQTLNVNLLGPTQQPVVSWTFLNAWPVKWEVGRLDASNSNSVLTQTLEFAYDTVTTKLVASGG